ncbi:DUF7344 domain-containing protein [Halopiger aswanensis]|uniref:DUF7344 domain-containing protein n=1 Tax=Halopiger aswanensis TaxID=148449 RepID=A0A3R7GYP0_9EURY|nr:hypothetical protein [Halopiger aswanensis]RKD98120.1 hypothetical protein ATJ93_1124 [Halopiger aswanensis]
MGDSNRLRRDELHRIAANERRRTIVATIRDRGAITVDELVAAIAECEPPANPAPIDRRTVIEVELLHVHIPMLRAAGVIDFDPTQRRVTPRQRIAHVDEMLSDEYELASP